MIELEDTGDGSPTLYSSMYDAAYHSRRGALAEGQYVFIKNGIEWYLERHEALELHILEMGLGTGLNAFLAAQFAMENSIKVQYTGVEKHPVSVELNMKFAEAGKLQELPHYNLYEAIINADWEERRDIYPFFSLRKCEIDFRDYRAEEKYDIVFYDAFGPRSQPELWDEFICENLYKFLKPKGIVTTFCAQGQFKRNLKAAGFIVHSMEGALGKREMVVAEKV